MADYLALIAQRDELNKQIAAARKEQLSGAWKAINKTMATYSITKEEVIKHYSGKTTRVSAKPVAIKYRNGDLTWAGRGKMPRFFRDAKTNGTLEQFRV
jgi:DNA-binding protein H-NS